MDYEEVRQFDCGSKGHDGFPDQVKLPTTKPLLRDVIVAIEHHIKSYSLYEVDYNLEIKTTPAGDNKLHPTPEVFSDLVFNLVDQYLPLERVVIQSFDFRVLRYWHQKYPDIRLSALIENTKSVEANLRALGFHPSVYSLNYKLLTKAKVDYLKKLKPKVIIFLTGVNDIENDGPSFFDKLIIKHAYPDLLHFLYNNSEVVNAIVNLSRGRQARKFNNTTQEMKVPGALGELNLSETEMNVMLIRQNKYLDAYEGRITALIDTCKQNNILPVFITQPALYLLTNA